MRLIITGATGMLGFGVLREALIDPAISEVLLVARRPQAEWPKGVDRSKVKELTFDLKDFESKAPELIGYDACIFCLGISSAGMTEESYRAVTYDLTLRMAKTLVKVSPGMTFEYISGAGTNTKGRSMWQRVKGETEDALLALGFAKAFMLRPGVIIPRHGAKSGTKLYRAFYVVGTPLAWLVRPLLRNSITDTAELGKVMIALAKKGAAKNILESKDIVAIGKTP